jgi:hypothetical protein
MPWRFISGILSFFSFLGKHILFDVRKNNWFRKKRKQLQERGIKERDKYTKLKCKIYKNRQLIIKAKRSLLIHLKEFERWLFRKKIIGKRSELQISQRGKPKIISKKLETITTSKMAFELITTTTSQRRKWLLSWSLHQKEWKEHRKDQFCLIFTFWLPMA